MSLKPQATENHSRSKGSQYCVSGANRAALRVVFVQKRYPLQSQSTHFRAKVVHSRSTVWARGLPVRGGLISTPSPKVQFQPVHYKIS